MLLARHFLRGIRHWLKQLPITRLLRNRFNKSVFHCLYYVRRIVGYVTFPVLGARAPLRGFYERTKDYLKNGEGLYIELEISSNNPQPVHPGQSRSDIFIAIIPKGRTIYSSGAVVSPDHKLLVDVSWEDFALGSSRYLSHPIMRQMLFPKEQHIKGSAAVITSYMPDNYYHWLFDILPRFDILHRSNIVPDYYLVNTDLAFQQESLNLLKIPSNKILSPTTHTNFEFDKLIIPSLPGPVLDTAPHPQEFSCNFLRSTFLEIVTTVTPYRSLYITRADAPSRRVINEAEVRQLALNYEFEIISLSGVPIHKQIELFSEAKIVVGAHGAGLSNAVFCQPGSIMIEFMPESRSVDCFKRLAQIIGMEYHSIIGRENNETNLSNDHAIDIAELSEILSRF